MRRCSGWKWLLLVFVAVVIVCLAPTYLLLVKGTNYWGSGILRVKDAEDTTKTAVESTRKIPETGNRVERIGATRTVPTSKTHRKILDASPIAKCCADLMNLNKEKALVIGHRMKKPGFLTIGIPYIPRAGGKSDLLKTLESLIKNAPSGPTQSQVSVVVFTSALDPGFRKSARDVVSGFPDQVRDGFLQVIEAPRSFYPNLSALGSSFLSGRVRTSLDIAFLLAYAMDTSEFYLHFSHYLMAPPNYLQSIHDFIRLQGASYWVALEFYPVGFTGKLFRGGGRDVQQLIHLLTEYNQQQSLESLFVHFKNLNVQQRQIIRRPPLFTSM